MSMSMLRLGLFIRVSIPVLMLFCVPSVSFAVLINSPVHDDHNNASDHNHRTGHDVKTGTESHGGVSPYVASKSWQNDQTLHSLFDGAHSGAIGHGHVEKKNAIPFHVHKAESGSGTSDAERDAWNTSAAGLAKTAFANWQAASIGSDDKAWSDDKDHVAGDIDRSWHSELNWTEHKPLETSAAHKGVHGMLGDCADSFAARNS